MKGKQCLQCGACGKRGVHWQGEKVITMMCRYCKARDIFMSYACTVEKAAANLRTDEEWARVMAPRKGDSNGLS